MRSHFASAATRTLLLATLFACTNCSEAEERSQLLVVVDTDLPVSGQLVERPELSADAFIDSVRVDLFESDGITVAESRLFTAPDVRDWPLSFGIAVQDETVRLRIRGFQARRSTRGDLDGEIIREPLPEVAIDRIVELQGPEAGVRAMRVVLRGDCMGRRPSFVSGGTCVDGAQIESSARAGLEEVDASALPATLAGSWPLAVERPCLLPPPGSGEVRCVKGGFTVLGDPAFRHVEQTLVMLDATPMHPIVVPALYMDRTEITVGRLRGMIADGSYQYSELPLPKDDPSAFLKQFCTWLGPDDDANDEMPVNCLTADVAREICKAAGGVVPTEAQWEHAARGRGEGRTYPWGEVPPECCTATIARIDVDDVNRCPQTEMGPAPVATHVAPCGGGASDVSRDDILDLGGSVSEVTRDGLEQFDKGDWAQEGVLVDPVCKTGTAEEFVARGGTWRWDKDSAATARRGRFDRNGAESGVRCVYRAEEVE